MRKLFFSAAVMLISVGSTQAQTFTSGKFQFEIQSDSEKSVSIIGTTVGTSISGSLSIPESVEYNSISYKVTTIGQSAFSNCVNLTGTLTIPNSITTIKTNAFSYCVGLTGSLVIPDNVTKIENYAFYECSGFNGSLTIGKAVASIGNYAFYNCTGFKGALIFNAEKCLLAGNTSYPVFVGCKFSEVIFGDDVTTIPANILYNCAGINGTITFGEKITKVGDYAFHGCKGLSGTLKLPNSINTLGSYSFYNCQGITAIYLPSECKSFSSSVFNGCNGVKDLHSRSTTPPSIINGSTIGGIDPALAALHLPSGTQVLNEYLNAPGWKSFKNILQEIPTSIDQESSITISLLHDPSSSTIQLIGANKDSYQIVNIYGRTIAQGVYQGDAIQTGSLPTGAYLLMINGQTLRFINR